MRFLLFLFYFIFSLASEYALAQNYGGWEIADSLIFPRLYHASVALPNGDILVTGGEDTVFMKQCEIYNYQTQKWSMTTPMISGRIEHDLVLLKNGKVMAVGGYKNRSCEIFNTIDETWELADSLLTSRTFGQTVTMLNNGNILIGKHIPCLHQLLRLQEPGKIILRQEIRFTYGPLGSFIHPVLLFLVLP